MQQRRYFVYMHIAPNNKKYIGITCKSKPEYRWVNGKGYIDNEHFYRAINKYGWDNIEHIVVAKDLLKEEACSLEKELIIKHKTHNKKFGYNNTFGGEANIPSEHTLQKMRGKTGELNPMFGRKMPESAKQRLKEINTGKKMSELVKEKISKANKGKNTWLKGKQISDEHKHKISEGLKGRVFSEEHKNKLSVKARETHIGAKVGQYDKELKLIKIWNNCREVERVLSIPNSHLYRAVKTNKTRDITKDKLYSVRGFIWMYV